jgi:uncharacterized membrane protein YgcG
MIVMFVASLGVAGTTVVMTTAQTMLSQIDAGDALQPPAAQSEQPVQVDPLERQLRPYQVRLNPAGEIEGRVNIVNPASGGVATAQEMTITFLQRGTVVAQRRPGIEGVFQVPLAPGVYSVVGSGPDGYFAYAMHVLPAELTVNNDAAGETQPVAFQEVLSELAIDTVAVPVTDLPMVVNLARNNIPPELLSPTPSGDALTPGLPLSPQETAEFSPQADVSLDGHQVQIREDGRLVGRMHRINQAGEPVRIRRLNVFLVRDNQVIAQAPVSELGRFEFFDVADGVYSFVAAGMDGLAAFTMQAVSGPNLAGVPDELDLSYVQVDGENNAAATTDPESTGFAVNAAQTTGEQAGVPGMEPFAEPGLGGGGGFGGGAGGGAAGGGGFGGGEGLLAALIGAGIGAAIGYAIADDDGGRRRLVSPFQPGSPFNPPGPPPFIPGN